MLTRKQRWRRLKGHSRSLLSTDSTLQKGPSLSSKESEKQEPQALVCSASPCPSPSASRDRNQEQIDSAPSEGKMHPLEALAVGDSLLHMLGSTSHRKQLKGELSPSTTTVRRPCLNKSRRSTGGRGRVRFNHQVRVVLVPARKELHRLKTDIWWGEEDYTTFRREYIIATRAALELRCKMEAAAAAQLRATEMKSPSTTHPDVKAASKSSDPPIHRRKTGATAVQPAAERADSSDKELRRPLVQSKAASLIQREPTIETHEVPKSLLSDSLARSGLGMNNSRIWRHPHATGARMVAADFPRSITKESSAPCAVTAARRAFVEIGGDGADADLPSLLAATSSPPLSIRHDDGENLENSVSLRCGNDGLLKPSAVVCCHEGQDTDDDDECRTQAMSSLSGCTDDFSDDEGEQIVDDVKSPSPPVECWGLGATSASVNASVA